MPDATFAEYSEAVELTVRIFPVVEEDAIAEREREAEREAERREADIEADPH